MIQTIIYIWLTLLGAASCTPQLHKASDDKEYLIETELKYNWYEAWHKCARREFQLVVIDTETKNNAIIKLLKKVIGKSHNLWLGGIDNFSRSGCARSFFWLPRGKQFTFSYWSDFNPDNAKWSEHCVHIWDVKSQYQWNDGECTNKMGFICEPNPYWDNYKNKTAAIQQSKKELQQLKENTKSAVQAFLHAKNNTVEQLKEKLLQQVQDLSNDLIISPME